MLIAQTTSDLIAAELRQEILRGKVAPGAAFRQEELARRFSVSRIPVREALRMLERDGLVEVHPNRGAFVVQLTAAQIEEITDLRVLVEGDLLYRAIPQMSDADRHRIASSAKAADIASTTPDWSEADRRFHETLYVPAQRPRQLALTMSLRSSTERYWAIYGLLPKKRGEWLRDHAALVRACQAGDRTSGRRVLRDHIGRAGQFLIDSLRRNERA